MIFIEHDIPVLKSKKEVILKNFLYYSFKILPAIIALFFISFNIVVVFFVFILNMILTGIVFSKIRTYSIPYSQLEFNYSEKEVLTWFVFKFFKTYSYYKEIN